MLRLTEEQKNELFAGLRSVLERAMSQNDEHKKRLADAGEREETLQNTERVYVSIDYFPVIEQGE